MIWQLVRNNWPRLLPIIVFLIPLLVLLVMGFVHLFHMKWFFWWCLGAALLAMTVILIQRMMQHAASRPISATSSQPEVAWTCIETRAWEDVQAIAKQVESKPPTTLAEIQSVVLSVIVAVAHRLHHNTEFASAKFTLPDILLAVEKGVTDLRSQVIRRVPGSDVIHVSDLMSLHSLYEKHGSVVKAVWFAYRAYRMFLNPVQAAVQESKSAFESQGAGTAWNFVKGQFARVIIEELGRGAIDLYGGRLRVDAQELVAAVNAAAPAITDAMAVRVVLVGQVNAGKSSLVNALMEDVRATVSELPTPNGLIELRLQHPDRPDLVLIDTPGLDGAGKGRDAMIDAVLNADLVLWVVSAASPARKLDQDTLNILQQTFDQRPDRKAAPVLIVATHVDRISPQREWLPPYDVQLPATGKATNIRMALDAISADLPHAKGFAVPVALRSGEQAYNLEALWVAMGMNLSEAKHAALHRTLKDHSKLNFTKLGSQFVGGGQFIANMAMKGAKQRFR
jgi:predicted GTPase